MAIPRRVGVSGGGALLSSGGGGPQNVTINANFPSVTNKDEIKKAFAELQHENYAKTQRPGKGALYGGRV